MPMDMMNRGGGPPGRMMEDESDTSSERPRVFLSKADLGGRPCQKGDTLTLRVTDVDAESGDVEAEIAESGETEDNTPGYMADFDKAMPEDEESEYE